MDGKPCQVPHRINAVGFQPLDGAGTGHPEIRQRSVVPQQIPVGLLVQLCNADTIFIRRDVLCHNVHGQLCKVEVGADACRCGDAGVVQHLPHHGHGKFMGAHVDNGQIARHINENLVDGVGVNVCRGHIFEVGLVDSGWTHPDTAASGAAQQYSSAPAPGLRSGRWHREEVLAKRYLPSSPRTALCCWMAVCSRWAFTSFTR